MMEIRRRNIIILVMLVLTFVFGINSTVYAAEFRDDGIVELGEIIDDDVFLSGQEVHMDGTINGSLIVSGDIITITGTVNGDLLVGGRNVFVTDSAVINGNVFSGSQLLQIDGQVTGSVFAGGASIILGETALIDRNVFVGSYSLETSGGSKVSRDIFVGAYQAVLKGTIDRDATLGVGAIDLQGSIGRDLILDISTPGENADSMFVFSFFSEADLPDPITPGLNISESSVIGGDLIYTSGSEQPEGIHSQPEGTVIYRTPVPDPSDGQTINRPDSHVVLFPSSGFGVSMIVRWFLDLIRNLITYLLLGALVLWLLRPHLVGTVDTFQSKPLPSLGYGVLTFLGGYIGSLLIGMVVFLVGLLFGLMTLGKISGLVYGLGFSTLGLAFSVFSLLAWIGSKLIVAYLIGDLIMKSASPKSPQRSIWAMLIGILIVVILVSIPIVGSFIVSPLMSFFALGAISLYIVSLRRGSHLSEIPAAADEAGDLSE